MRTIITTKTTALILGWLLSLSVLQPDLTAQGLTGQVSGTVIDPAGAVIAGTKVQLLNTGTGQTRESATDSAGAFVFTELLPGAYRAVVEGAGFKRYEQKDIILSATERVTLRPIVLTNGEVSETVSVTAEAARIQPPLKIRPLSLKGRDYLIVL